MKSYQLYESYKVGTERKSPPAVLQVSAHCIKIMLYFLSISATKPEVEGFRDQGFVLPEVESLRVQSLWLLKKALPSREEPDISLSILNSKARFYTNTSHAYY